GVRLVANEIDKGRDRGLERPVAVASEQDHAAEAVAESDALPAIAEEVADYRVGEAERSLELDHLRWLEGAVAVASEDQHALIGIEVIDQHQIGIAVAVQVTRGREAGTQAGRGDNRCPKRAVANAQ